MIYSQSFLAIGCLQLAYPEDQQYLGEVFVPLSSSSAGWHGPSLCSWHYKKHIRQPWSSSSSDSYPANTDTSGLFFRLAFRRC